MKINLVLDLDETLIHTIIKPEPNVFKPVEYYKDTFIIDNEYYHVYFRTYMEQFIDNMSERYNIYIYSNGLELYVKNAINLIENKNKIKDIFYRKTFTSPVIKDLKNLNLNPNNTVIVDDRLDVWQTKYYDNLLTILPFYYGSYVFSNSDDCLEYTEKRLIALHKLYNRFNCNVDIRNIINYSIFMS